MFFHLLTAFASICALEALPSLNEKTTGVVFVTVKALGFPGFRLIFSNSFWIILGLTTQLVHASEY
ncbi:MAG: hypothetical protein C0508_12535 [Cyanobacteria bacterium PR.023]|nr:hypothetical protein [Cyanobacteria bacterium PR.023]